MDVVFCGIRLQSLIINYIISLVTILKAARKMSFRTRNDDVSELVFNGIRMSGKPANSRWNVCCKNGRIDSISRHVPLATDQDDDGRFLIPSLCHPHIHLDKCFLLSHPKYADLEIQKGDFAEAMKLTSRSNTPCQSSRYSQSHILFHPRRSKVSI